jgi:two-component system, LytTR family, response regulator
VKALIVDDERLARNELRRMLKNFPEIEIAGEAKNSDEAHEQILHLHPDLLFLDIQMPGGDGFQLLERLENVPLVIFTTAFDKYALKAFEVNALDYLQKPIAPERLAAAIAKVSARRSLLTSASSAPVAKNTADADRQIFVRDGERCWFVTIKNILLMESEGNYTRLHFDGNRPLLLRSLTDLLERLDPAIFFRANRKQIINLKFVESIAPWPNEGYLVKLRGGFQVEMSRRQAQKFQAITSL